MWTLNHKGKSLKDVRTWSLPCRDLMGKALGEDTVVQRGTGRKSRWGEAMTFIPPLSLVSFTSFL